MFHVGNIPTKDQVQFGDFWNVLGIFRNSTNLQNKNRNRNKGKKLTWRHPEAHLPAQPSHRSSELLGLARQAGSCSTASTACVPRSCPPPRRFPRAQPPPPRAAARSQLPVDALRRPFGRRSAQNHPRRRIRPRRRLDAGVFDLDFD